ncbi:A disintegrin and metalloproteinase with thrombospondin motifs adt-1-like [Uloborus diversus]|uniref:A disintegrin and metalloproteinase with thrombospondin motifs adt-1-like n=1 Tax=Uloborus diversus TaxID=327109 RepID=UPI0024092C1A|nr:A disintegrin and metalloproteinase with thrombospondin motifs adt-1-like [Uloborus diversus]
MCRRNYSCTLIEGANFEAAFVIAHEIAHNLGVLHDGKYNECDQNKYIMSSKTGPGKVHWSRCSNRYINDFIQNGKGWCLKNEEPSKKRSFDLASILLPGLIYSLSDQCKLSLGSNYTAYRSSKEPFNNVCRELWCASGSWAKAAHPALEGSACGNGKV